VIEGSAPEAEMRQGRHGLIEKAFVPSHLDEFLLAATAQNLRKLAKLILLPAPIFTT
jgi:hypothetical protein